MAKITMAQRVEIAKDVLKQIKIGSIAVATGSYISLPDDPDTIIVPKKYEKLKAMDIQDLIKTGKLKNCEVCARGAMILSKARLFDTCKVPVREGSIDACDLNELVGEDMSRNTFGDFGLELEAAFEGWDSPDDGGWPPENYEEGVATFPDWCVAYPDATERLTVLMENVIRNKGKFVVSDMPDPDAPKVTVKKVAKKTAKKKVAKK